MKVHLINKGLVTQYLNDNPKARKGLTLWITIMNHADWDRVSDIDQSFGLPFISKGQREIIFEFAASNVTITCGYYFHIKRVHLLIRHIQINEVQSN
jgi:mRNA-degrading endonuclease HigB of HigAB toxin-antitoxin module